jgi:hypothetical protein
VITAADARLVGEKEELVTQRPRPTQSVGGAGNEFHTGRIGEVDLVDNERAVAVEEKRARGASRSGVGGLGFWIRAAHGVRDT